MAEAYNREGWLTALARAAEPAFKGFRIAPYRVTCGWPAVGGLGRRRRVVGVCHDVKHSRGGVYELFISPTLEEPLEVAGTVLHEMAHVVAGIAAAHGRNFAKVCHAAGLTKGKPRVVMPGPRLEGRLAEIIAALGPYPHRALVPALKAVKPGTQLTLACAECGCTVRIGRKWYTEAGAPTCGCGGTMSPVEKGE